MYDNAGQRVVPSENRLRCIGLGARLGKLVVASWLYILCISPSAPPVLGQDASQASNLGIAFERPSSGRFVPIDGHFLVSYTQTIPDSTISFEMIPIPGGQLRIPVDERSGDTSPLTGDEQRSQIVVEIPPFWMAKYETGWGAYAEFMDMHDTFRHVQHHGGPNLDELEIDPVTVTAPTTIYDLTYRLEFATSPLQPASTMSQFAARQYTKWLSQIVPGVYRLPTEAEWTYAALAGAAPSEFENMTEAEIRSFANALGPVDEHGFLLDEEDYRGTSSSGERRANDWGLHDMQGNVAEWVIDSGGKSITQRLKPGRYSLEESIGWAPSTRLGHLACGGSWVDEPQDCKPLSRKASNKDWWQIDPRLPNSPWWIGSGDDLDRGIGFRIIRPYNPGKPTSFAKYWEPDSRELARDVKISIDDGIGITAQMSPMLLKPPWRVRSNKERPWLKESR